MERIDDTIDDGVEAAVSWSFAAAAAAARCGTSLDLLDESNESALLIYGSEKLACCGRVTD